MVLGGLNYAMSRGKNYVFCLSGSSLMFSCNAVSPAKKMQNVKITSLPHG